ACSPVTGAVDFSRGTLSARSWAMSAAIFSAVQLRVLLAESAELATAKPADSQAAWRQASVSVETEQRHRLQWWLRALQVWKFLAWRLAARRSLRLQASSHPFWSAAAWVSGREGAAP